MPKVALNSWVAHANAGVKPGHSLFVTRVGMAARDNDADFRKHANVREQFERLSFDGEGDPLELLVSTYRGDKYRIYVLLRK